MSDDNGVMSPEQAQMVRIERALRARGDVQEILEFDGIALESDPDRFRDRMAALTNKLQSKSK